MRFNAGTRRLAVWNRRSIPRIGIEKIVADGPAKAPATAAERAKTKLLERLAVDGKLVRGNA